jgi:hypothetical protein
MKAISSIIIGYVGLVVSSVDVRAETTPIGFITGNMLSQYCDAPAGTTENGLCKLYIGGVSDGVNLTNVRSHQTNRYFCLRQGVTLGQLGLIVVKYLKAHPEYLDLNAADLVIESLGQAFPCASK